MAIPTDSGLSWYNRYGAGQAPGPIDTMAVGTGTGTEDPTATSLQNEIYRASMDDSVVEIVQSQSDSTLQFAVIELTGGLEVPAGTEVTEVGVVVSSADPEVLVWYSVSSPVPFPSGESNKLRIPMDFNRGSS